MPEYVTKTMTREHLVPKCFEGMAQELVGEQVGDQLLDYMLHNGKRMYLLDLFQPHVSEAVKFGITKKQVDWLYANEFNMWKEVFVKYLYENDLKKEGLIGLVNPAPTSPGMPDESPGNTGTWVGYRIISSYMKYNPNVTLEQLLAEKDPQKILKGARYKPK
jgi:hypothetical protein